MPEHLIRIHQSLLLLDSTEVVIQAATPEDAARLVIDATCGDPDDAGDTRGYRLPDGQSFELDPEEIVGGEVYAEIIVDGKAVRTVGRSKPLELDGDEHQALLALLAEAIVDTGSNRKAALFASVMRKLGGGDVPC